MEPLNYLRQATEQIRAQLPTIKANRPKAGHYVEETLHLMREAIKFTLPEGGRILADGLRGLEGSRLQLPFSTLIVEYHWERMSHIIYAAQIAPMTLEIRMILRRAAMHNGIRSPEPLEHLDTWIVLPVFATIRVDKTTHPDGLGKVVSLGGGDFAEVEGLVSEYRSYFEEVYSLSPAEKSDLQAEASSRVYPVMELIEALSCTNVSHEALPVRKVNKSATKRGALPFDEYRVLVVNAARTSGGRSVSSKHRSPREHLRRGHIRRLDTGNIWVSACIVAAGADGRIQKEYVFK